MAFALATSDEVFLFKTPDVQSLSNLPDLQALPSKVAFSKAGEFVCTTEGGAIWVWTDLSKLEERALIASKSEGPISCLLLDVLDGLSIIYSQGSKVHVSNARTGQHVRTFEHFTSSVTDISLGVDEALLAVGYANDPVVVFNRRHGSQTIIPVQPKGKRRRDELLVYDILKPTSPQKIIRLDLPSPSSLQFIGNATDLAFNSLTPHCAIVTDAGLLVTVNAETGSVRAREIRVPLTSVVWSGRSEVLIGTGKLNATWFSAKTVTRTSRSKPTTKTGVEPRPRPSSVVVPPISSTHNPSSRSSSRPTSAPLTLNSADDEPLALRSSSPSLPALPPARFRPIQISRPSIGTEFGTELTSVGARTEAGTRPEIRPIPSTSSISVSSSVSDPRRGFPSPSSPVGSTRRERSHSPPSPRSDRSIGEYRRGGEREGEGRKDELIWMLSNQIKDLHLDMLRSRRQTKLETKALFDQTFRRLDVLQRENEALRSEINRLNMRPGYSDDGENGGNDEDSS
ncbi:WD40/YVTN repeat-like-containing domain [Phaffia rhodozyma]|uniref:WD40/YVTN repeat-like-containing domain n=1 Tax=Phaffia rhodozyma TaxID=264483 RepID=A0A0F7SPG9_PHARH|nr:WD40/YVTN repeat-like-containing domain [Phaffia rhodozyma]